MIKLPMKIAYDLIMADIGITTIVSPDHIFMLDVPEDYQTLAKLPVIRVVEIDSRQNSFASNMPISMGYAVQIDVWSGSLAVIEQTMNKLDELMTKNGWAQYAGSIETDSDIADTPRLYRRYKAIQQIN